MFTRSMLPAMFLLAAVACGGNDTLPTRPTPNDETTTPTGTPAPATDIVGDYDLIFTASPTCSLPGEFRQRTYKANVRAWTNFPSVAVDVSGGTFLHDWAVGFDGRRDGERVRFTIIGVQDDPFSSGLAEVIDQTKWLTYDGTAVVATTANSITTGPFDGLIKLRDAGSGATLAECRATDHTIAFVR